jgi:hypothetical protein
MRLLSLALVVGSLSACGPAERPAASASTRYDPDAADAWRFSVDTVQGEMDVAPRVSPTLVTFGERDVLPRDSTVGVVLQFSCDSLGELSGWVATSDYIDEDRGARVRIDSAPPFVPEVYLVNTDFEGFVEFQRPDEMLGRLEHAQRLLVEFTPRAGLQSVARFNVRGLGAHLSTFRAACAPAKAKGDSLAAVQRGAAAALHQRWDPWARCILALQYRTPGGIEAVQSCTDRQPAARYGAELTVYLSRVDLPSDQREHLLWAWQFTH